MQHSVRGLIPWTARFVVYGRIRLGDFVEHFESVEHISYSSGTSRNSERRNFHCDVHGGAENKSTWAAFGAENKAA